MSSFWHDPQSEHLVAANIAGDQPAWVWEADSERLVWRNRAAIAYEAAERRQPHDWLVPVPRQVPRAVRMGVPHLSSRARLQFSIGRKPLSATCICTPIHLGGHVPALLVVMQTALAEEVLSGTDFPPESVAPFIGKASHYALIGADGGALVGGGDGIARLAAGEAPQSSLPAGKDARLVFFSEAPAEILATVEDTASELDMAPDQTTAPAEVIDEPEAPAAENELSLGSTHDADEPERTEPASPEAAESDRRDALVDLIDRLDSRQVLYQPLGENDDGTFAPHDAEATDIAEEPPAPEQTDAEPSGSEIAELADEPDEIDETPQENSPPPARKLWKVVGRGLSLLHGGKDQTGDEDETRADRPGNQPDEVPAADSPEEHIEETLAEIGTFDIDGADDDALSSPAGFDKDASGATLTDAELEMAPDRIADLMGAADTEIEQTSRYNFDELSRILNDRVSGEPDPSRQRQDPADATGSGALVNLGDETLILNRLPIGLLVFRDQQILFNNRAFTDLLGYLDGTSLRRAGLAGVFPPDGDQETAGPITRLLGADGRVLQVSARLQMISWQGRPALMLSASRHKEPLNAEVLARGFANSMAGALGFGYFETSRAGIISSVSGQAAILSHRSPDTLIGRPIHSLIALAEGARLRTFLEEPARFAGGDRPSIRLEGMDPGVEIIVFAEGMAGIVTGYFGFIRARAEQNRDAGAQRIDPDFLIRLSRAMRQPVNAIAGFADMIRSEAFGPIGESRYVDYGRFISGAGRDIAGMIDELEDYARLRDDDYPIDIARISLADLLHTAIARVRPFAATTRVFVRSAISATLPEISADTETLTQAVLNVLATAIAHSPPGGQVVLSAQGRSDGAVEVHVRDSGKSGGDAAEDAFTVFRDGKARDGETRTPAESAIGLALTRTLVAVNSMTLDIDPDRGSGTLFSLIIPADLVVRADSATS